MGVFDKMDIPSDLSFGRCSKEGVKFHDQVTGTEWNKFMFKTFVRMCLKIGWSKLKKKKKKKILQII